MVRQPRSVERPSTSRIKAVDVAVLAGVSSATVSLVANGKASGRVSEQTQQRVLRAIAELGYVVDSAARSLATGRRRCVALFAKDMTNPFISNIAAGVSEALGSHVQLLLAVGDTDDDAPGIGQILGFGVDGLLLDFPLEEDTLDGVTPYVVLDDPRAADGASNVYFDLEASARDLADHLVDHGHRTILYLDSSRQAATFDQRRRVVRDQLRRRTEGMRVITADSAITIDDARATIAGGWPRWDRNGVTAVVTASDVQAYGALAAFDELGVAVPEGVSVASFDDLPYSVITSPPLTAIRLSAFDLGLHAARLLQELIDDSAGAPRRTVTLPTELVMRGSTGPARPDRPI